MMLKQSSLRRAASFHAVARTGSIAAAARELGKSGPAVHHDLRTMERELGRPLFIKVGRTLRLTPSARELFESIARSLDEIDRAGDRFRQGAEAGETLRVAAVSGFGRYRLAPRLLRSVAAQRRVARPPL